LSLSCKVYVSFLYYHIIAMISYKHFGLCTALGPLQTLDKLIAV